MHYNYYTKPIKNFTSKFHGNSKYNSKNIPRFRISWSESCILMPAHGFPNSNEKFKCYPKTDSISRHHHSKSKSAVSTTLSTTI